MRRLHVRHPFLSGPVGLGGLGWCLCAVVCWTFLISAGRWFDSCFFCRFCLFPKVSILWHSYQWILVFSPPVSMDTDTFWTNFDIISIHGRGVWYKYYLIYQSLICILGRRRSGRSWRAPRPGWPRAVSCAELFSDGSTHYAAELSIELSSVASSCHICALCVISVVHSLQNCNMHIVKMQYFW